MLLDQLGDIHQDVGLADILDKIDLRPEEVGRALAVGGEGRTEGGHVVLLEHVEGHAGILGFVDRLDPVERMVGVDVDVELDAVLRQRAQNPAALRRRSVCRALRSECKGRRHATAGGHE